MVVGKTIRHPNWNRDELVLALALYMSSPASPPDKGNAKVVELSTLLNKMHRVVGTAHSSTLRNANGVYLKMMNLRALDPEFTAKGKVGMTSGGKLEREIWNEYANDLEKLEKDSREIRQVINNIDEHINSEIQKVDEYVAKEGGFVISLHKRYERSRKLAHLKPVSEIGTGGKTRMADLALLCANCHRMAHRKLTPLSLKEIGLALAK